MGAYYVFVKMISDKACLFIIKPCFEVEGFVTRTQAFQPDLAPALISLSQLRAKGCD